MFNAFDSLKKNDAYDCNSENDERQPQYNISTKNPFSKVTKTNESAHNGINITCHCSFQSKIGLHQLI